MTGETDISTLIIDDAPESPIALKKLLRPKYRVLMATLGATGLRVMVNLPKPDLIMPDRDGFETLTQCSTAPSPKTSPSFSSLHWSIRVNGGRGERPS